MKIAKVITAFTISALGLNIVSAPLSVKAAAWHNGTPKALRGSWYYHKNKQGWRTIRFNKSTVNYGQMGMPGIKVKEMYYQHKTGSSIYHLTGYGVWTPNYGGGRLYFKVVKHGSHIKLTGEYHGIYYK